jgi:hypothetical protein
MTTLAKIDRDTLIDAFRQAAAAALAADPGPQADGGTCNFDTPALRLPSIRERFVEECATEAGISASAFAWLGGRRWFFVFVPLHGQASRRSRMAEAACGRLKELEAPSPWPAPPCRGPSNATERTRSNGRDRAKEAKEVGRRC